MAGYHRERHLQLVQMITGSISITGDSTFSRYLRFRQLPHTLFDRDRLQRMDAIGP